MGFLVNFNRKMYLTNYINLLESKITERTQVKLEMADQIAQYTSEINDFADKDSPAVKKLESKKAELEAMEKKIDADQPTMHCKVHYKGHSATIPEEDNKKIHTKRSRKSAPFLLTKDIFKLQ